MYEINYILTVYKDHLFLGNIVLWPWHRLGMLWGGGSQLHPP